MTKRQAVLDPIVLLIGINFWIFLLFCFPIINFFMQDTGSNYPFATYRIVECGHFLARHYIVYGILLLALAACTTRARTARLRAIVIGGILVAWAVVMLHLGVSVMYDSRIEFWRSVSPIHALLN